METKPDFFNRIGQKQSLENSMGPTIFPTTARFSNCSPLAAFVLAVLHGKAIQAKSGFSRDTLDAVVDQAL
ncbi:hypothetical protein D3C76_729830 [compost metagenome]